MTAVSHFDPEEEEPGGPAARQIRRWQRCRARRAADQTEPDAYTEALAKGITGEQLVGAALEQQLTGTGVLLRNSIQFLVWGDIDHLAVGPGGITVIDAKNWTGQVTVRNGAPRIGGRQKTQEVTKLRRQCAGVRLALLNARPDLRGTEVRGVLCLAAEPDRTSEPLRDGFALCGSAAAAALAARPGVLAPHDIDHICETLVRCIPRVTRAEVDDLLGEPAAPERTRARSRRRGRRRRRLIARAVTALGTLAGGLIVAYGITKLHLVFPGASSTVTHLRVIDKPHGPAVTFTAARGERVQLTLSRRHHRQAFHLTATGAGQQWRVPATWRHVGGFSVRGCVIDTPNHCLTAPARAQFRAPAKRHR